jgi:pimeloyl-ACP methyl ester carboxylesterase
MRLLLLHGILATSACWEPLRRELGRDEDVVTPDLLGCGTSPRPRDGYSLDRVVDDLARVVERERPTHLVGHSMGAIVALGVARRFPGEFTRVGLIGLPIFRDRPDGVAYLRSRRGPVIGGFLANDRAAHAACRMLFQTRQAWAAAVPLVLPWEPPPVAAAVFDHCESSHSGGLDNIVFAGRVAELASGLDTPVSALHGGRDCSAPIDRVRALALRESWDLRVAPKANHQVIVERPALVARWLRNHVLTDDEPVTDSASAAAAGGI